MSTKYKVIIVVSALAVSFASGRYLTPVKIKTETKIVEVEKKTQDTKESNNKHTHKTTVVTETDKPNGEKDKVTTVTEDTGVVDTKDNKTAIDDKVNSDTTKEEKKEGGKTSVALMAGAQVNPNMLSTPSLTTSPFVFGAHVQRSIIGPVTIGVWGLSNLTFGASVGILF
jgi:hypothetical protein